jgi:hypothetical protein
LEAAAPRSAVVVSSDARSAAGAPDDFSIALPDPLRRPHAATRHRPCRVKVSDR